MDGKSTILNLNLKFDYFRIFTEILDLRFKALYLASEYVKDAKTPAALEILILKQHPMKAGDFVFLEWKKFTEDILVTSERSALISTQTSNYFENYIIASNKY